MSEPYITEFINHGHKPDEHWQNRTEDGFLECQNCTAICGDESARQVCPKAEMIHVSVMRREINMLLENFAEIKSGKKIKKKVTQMFKRDIRRLTEMEVEERVKALNEAFKPKPKWLPHFIWSGMKSALLKKGVSIRTEI